MSTEIVTDAQLEGNKRLQGLDYLAFWAFGKFDKSDLFPRLQREQALAKDGHEERYLKIGGLEFSLKPSGSGQPGVYRRVYQLDCSGIYVGLCKETLDPKRPEMKVEIKGDLLLRLGEKNAWEFIQKIFKALGFKYNHSKISRVDLRADFVDFSPQDVFDKFEAGQGVTRAKKFNSYRGSSFEIETFYIGLASSEISCRVYDKFLDARSDKMKQRLIDQVLLDGATDIDRLTRVEFQLKRKAIVERYGVDSVEDFLDSLQIVVLDLCTDWLRIHADKVDRNNTEKGRDDDSKIDELWLSIRGAFVRFASGFKFRKLKVRTVKPQSVEKHRNMVVGYLCKIAAIEGTEINCVQDFINLIVEQFEQTGQRVSDVRKRVGKEARKMQLAGYNAIMDWFSNQAANDPTPLFSAAE